MQSWKVARLCGVTKRRRGKEEGWSEEEEGEAVRLRMQMVSVVSTLRRLTGSAAALRQLARSQLVLFSTWVSRRQFANKCVSFYAQLLVGHNIQVQDLFTDKLIV